MSGEAIRAIVLAATKLIETAKELADSADLTPEQRAELRAETKALEDRAHAVFED